MLRCAQAWPITVFGQSVFSEGRKGSKQVGPRVLGETSCGHTTDFEGGSSDWAPCLEGPKLMTSVHLVLLRLLQQITLEGGDGGVNHQMLISHSSRGWGQDPAASKAGCLGTALFL